MKYIKNADTVSHTWLGQEVTVGSYHGIQVIEESSWANNSILLTDMANGLAVIAKSSDGTQDITDVATAINFLHDVLDTRDSDNSLISRPKVAPLGWTYQIHCFELCTSTLDSVYSKNASLSDFGFITQKYYKDESNTECTDQTDADANCIKTVIDWEPTHCIELIGGEACWYSALSQDIRFWCVGVPDISAEYGGSKLFISGYNFRYNSVKAFRIDGRASKRMTYNATYHTGKFRFIFRHAAGIKFNLQVALEFYRS